MRDPDLFRLGMRFACGVALAVSEAGPPRPCPELWCPHLETPPSGPAAAPGPAPWPRRAGARGGGAALAASDYSSTDSIFEYATLDVLALNVAWDRMGRRGGLERGRFPNYFRLNKASK